MTLGERSLSQGEVSKTTRGKLEERLTKSQLDAVRLLDATRYLVASLVSARLSAPVTYIPLGQGRAKGA